LKKRRLQLHQKVADSTKALAFIDAELTRRKTLPTLHGYSTADIAPAPPWLRAQGNQGQPA